jgi:hypothetical protein
MVPIFDCLVGKIWTTEEDREICNVEEHASLQDRFI